MEKSFMEKLRWDNRGVVNMNVIDEINKNKICAIIRGIEANKIDKLARALINGGVKVVEVTFNTKGASEMIEYLVDNYSDDLLVGAGTVLDTETAKKAIDAGAKFILSPTLNADVIIMCNRYNVVPVPGVMTPTEALTAYENGAKIVKVFPAGVLSPTYIKQLLGPLNQLSIMAVGGVNPSNIKDFFDVGVSSVGIGSDLVDAKLVKVNNFSEIEERAKKLVEMVSNVDSY